MSIEDIIEKCGGREAISERADGLSADAIRKWPKNGIPEKRWSVLMKMHKGRLTAAMLHEINNQVRVSA